jgi:D-hydroxyproline dehydrogenase subunit gamma
MTTDPVATAAAGARVGSRAGHVRLTVDGRAVQARAEDTLAVALLNAGVAAFRRSLTGEARGPLCGMGSCMECRVRVDGRTHVRACLEAVHDGMEVETDG